MTSRLDPWTLAVLCAALGLRLAAAYHLDLNRGVSDTDAFIGIAKSIVQDGRYALDGKLTADRLPGYPLFLATLYAIDHLSEKAVLMAQALVGTLTVWVVMLIARRFWWPLWSVRLTGILAALYPFFIYYNARLLTETMAVFWVTACFYFFLRLRQTPDSQWNALAFGGSGALLVLTKASFLPWFVCLIVIEMARAGWKAAGKPTRPFKALVVAWIAFAAPLAGWVIRNAQVFGAPTIDTRGGLTCMECMVFYDQNKAGIFSAKNLAGLPAFGETAGLNELQKDQFYARVYRNFIRDHPKRFIKQALANVKDFWRFYPRRDLQSTRSFFWVSIAWEPALILLGFWGLWRARKRWTEFYPILLLIALLTAIHAITCAQMRYRLPLMPFFILFTTFLITSPPRKNDRGSSPPIKDKGSLPRTCRVED